ncbi:MAG: YaeQ family protein [SAR324 cluster bacterium]|uniref:YaeQ family protein n=1 Tax=SAR324 cluster bacterium TaxID=2024889 RepID=A0A7X9FQ15_9DELT|nr:YaeQ family protein [SAR324 cluster bacterium]
MAFTLGFYSFNVNLNDPTRGVYASFRLKTPRHPLESLEHLYARALAYAHAFEEGLSFSQGLFEEKEPTIWKKAFDGSIEKWIQVGVPDKKKFERALKQNPFAHFSIYFYEPQDIDAFCWMLRGSKTNWVENVSFFQIDSELLKDLGGNESFNSDWDINLIDSSMYLTANGIDYLSEIESIDIWNAFQRAIQNSN